MSQCALSIFGSKGQGYIVLITEICLYHIPSTVFALRTLFYCHVEQALAMLPVSQTRAETGADTQEVDLSPRLRVISALNFNR